MRIVTLNKKNNDSYKIVFSKNDWKKLILEVNHQIAGIIPLIVYIYIITVIVFLLFFDKLVYHLFHFFGFKVFYVMTCAFIGLPVFLLYLKSCQKIFDPFKLKGMKIDAIEKKIFLKNKVFYFKNTEKLVFYLRRKQDIAKNTPENKKNNEKGANDLVYYVKKEVSSNSNYNYHAKKLLIESNYEEFIVEPVEVKYVMDFDLILGKEGVLGVWRKIAMLLNVDFEEKIEWEEKIGPSIDTSLSTKTNNVSRLIRESKSLDDDEKNDTKMREILFRLDQKIKNKNNLEFPPLDPSDLRTFILFKDELMSVKTCNNCFEIRFWKEFLDFPEEKPLFNEKMVVFIGIMSIVGSLMLFYIGDYITAFLFIWLGAEFLRFNIQEMRSKSFLLKITFLIDYFAVFTSLYVVLNNVFAFRFNRKISILFTGILMGLFLLSTVLNGLHYLSCPWKLKINKYLSRLIFSFKDENLSGEYGFCISRNHWKISTSKLQSLALLRKADSSSDRCPFILVFRSEENYVGIPLPCVKENKIEKIFFFIQQAFEALLLF